ncbi:hypothetical protein ACFRCQ_20830 [Cytobacillus firmus]|uniref:hypothetical protein n=1 Tax=Cytobacillus firmus TaxID=1399 RepID=UPI00369B97E4
MKGKGNSLRKQGRILLLPYQRSPPIVQNQEKDDSHHPPGQGLAPAQAGELEDRYPATLARLWHLSLAFFLKETYPNKSLLFIPATLDCISLFDL